MRSKLFTIEKVPLLLFACVLACILLVSGYGLLKNIYISAGTIVPEYPAGYILYKSDLPRYEYSITGSQVKTFIDDYYHGGSSSLDFVFSNNEDVSSIQNTLTVNNKIIHDKLSFAASASAGGSADNICNLTADASGYASLNCGNVVFKMYYKSMLNALRSKLVH